MSSRGYCLPAVALLSLLALLPGTGHARDTERELVKTIELPPTGSFYANPRLVDDMLIIKSGDSKHLLCYNLDGIDQRWALDVGAIAEEYEFTDFDNMQFVAAAGGTYLFGVPSLGQQAIAINRLTGEVTGTCRLSACRGAVAMLTDAGEMAVATGSRGLVVLGGADFAVQHRLEIQAQANGIEFDEATGRLYFCVEKPPSVYSLDLARIVASEDEVSKTDIEMNDTGPWPFACCLAGDFVAVACWTDSSIHVHDRQTLEELAVYPALPSIDKLIYHEGCVFAASQMQAPGAYGSPGALLRLDPVTGNGQRRNLATGNPLEMQEYVIPGTLYFHDLGQVSIRQPGGDAGLPLAVVKDSRVVIVDAQSLETLATYEYPDGLLGSVCIPDRNLIFEIGCDSNQLKVYQVTEISE